MSAASWHPGQLEAWRRDDEGWRAYVRWSEGIGLQRLGWVDSHHVRKSQV